MDEPRRAEGYKEASSSESDSEPQTHALYTQGREHAEPSGTPESKRQKIKKYFKQLLAEKPDRHIELFLSLMVGFFAGTQLIVTHQQLDAFKKSADETSLTQTRINLPLVIPAGSSLLAENEEGRVTYKIVQKWGNQGQTRAVTPHIEWGWGPARPNRATGTYKYIDEVLRNSTLPPGGAPFADTRPLTEDEVSSLKAFKPGDPVYVYGRVWYTDIFPPRWINGKRRNDHLIEYAIRIAKVHITDTSADWVGEEIPYGYCFDENCGADYYEHRQDAP